jgi:hypothetical protein
MYGTTPVFHHSTIASFPGPFAAVGRRIMPNKANPARQGRWIDEGLLMIDYREGRGMEDSKAGQP